MNLEVDVEQLEVDQLELEQESMVSTQLLDDINDQLAQVGVEQAATLAQIAVAVQTDISSDFKKFLKRDIKDLELSKGRLQSGLISMVNVYNRILEGETRNSLTPIALQVHYISIYYR